VFQEKKASDSKGKKGCNRLVLMGILTKKHAVWRIRSCQTFHLERLEKAAQKIFSPTTGRFKNIIFCKPPKIFLNFRIKFFEFSQR